MITVVFALSLLARYGNRLRAYPCSNFLRNSPWLVIGWRDPCDLSHLPLITCLYVLPDLLLRCFTIVSENWSRLRVNGLLYCSLLYDDFLHTKLIVGMLLWSILLYQVSVVSILLHSIPIFHIVFLIFPLIQNNVMQVHCSII